jgi:hypothetical protein
MGKFPTIKAGGKEAHTFREKCDAFLQALFPHPKPPPRLTRSAKKGVIEGPLPWPTLSNQEIGKAIKAADTKKAPGSDRVNFLIIQKAFQAIPKSFEMVYSALLTHGYHPRCWKNSIDGRPGDLQPEA